MMKVINLNCRKTNEILLHTLVLDLGSFAIISMSFESVLPVSPPVIPSSLLFKVHCHPNIDVALSVRHGYGGRRHNAGGITQP